MEQMTMTEGLAEIKLIEKKIEKKKSLVLTNLIRFEHVPDPFVNDGGSTKALSKEVQSIQDLYHRLERIRHAIGSANMENKLTVGENSKSIYEWLVWKREIASKLGKFISDVAMDTKRQMDANAQRPQVYQDDKKETHLVRQVANLDYADFSKRAEKHEDVLGQLDGKLSLANATIVISF